VTPLIGQSGFALGEQASFEEGGGQQSDASKEVSGTHGRHRHGFRLCPPPDQSLPAVCQRPEQTRRGPRPVAADACKPRTEGATPLRPRTIRRGNHDADEHPASRSSGGECRSDHRWRESGLWRPSLTSTSGASEQVGRDLGLREWRKGRGKTRGGTEPRAAAAPARSGGGGHQSSRRGAGVGAASPPQSPGRTTRGSGGSVSTTPY
jgi:hypothetical protein